MTRHDYRREWVEDLANLVTCCRACNDFGNRFVVNEPAPTSPDDFFDLRDQVFLKRRDRIAAARAREKRDHFDNLFPTRAHRTRARGVNDDCQITVDFNSRDAQAFVPASSPRLATLPAVGSIISAIDHEENRCLAPVIAVGPASITLEPLWQTFSTPEQLLTSCHEPGR